MIPKILRLCPSIIMHRHAVRPPASIPPQPHSVIALCKEQLPDCRHPSYDSRGLELWANLRYDNVFVLSLQKSKPGCDNMHYKEYFCVTASPFGLYTDINNIEKGG